MIASKSILLTIDVEDWFQVENFKPWIPFETWDQRELRVERNVHRLLDLFDSLESAGKQEGRKAGRLDGDEAGEAGKQQTTSNSQLTFNHPQLTKNNSQLTTNCRRQSVCVRG